MPVRRRVGEIQSKESDDGRQRCNRHGYEVEPNGLYQRFSFAQAVTHQPAQRQKDVNRVGDGKCQNHDRRRHRYRCQLDATEAGNAHTDHRRQRDDDKRCECCRERPDNQPGQREDDNEHQWHQCRAIAHAGFGKRVVEHRHTGQVNIDVRILRLDPADEVARKAHGLRYFHQCLLRILQYDVDRGDARVPCEQLITQQGFGQGNVLPLAEIVGVLTGGIAYEVFDNEVVFNRIGVLKVADRVHANCVRYLPGFLSQLFHCIERLWRKRATAPRFENEKEIVVLGVGVLQVLEGLQLRVGVREEHPVVGGKLESARTGSRHRGEHHGKQDDEPAPRDNPLRQRGSETIYRLEITTHAMSPDKTFVTDWS